MPSQVDNVPTWKMTVFDLNILHENISITYYQCYDAKLHHLDYCMMNLANLVKGVSGDHTVVENVSKLMIL